MLNGEINSWHQQQTILFRGLRLRNYSSSAIGSEGSARNPFKNYVDYKRTVVRALDYGKMHSLCGDGNRAIFGSCLASAGTKLDIQLDPHLQAHPGLSFDISLRKVDFYNQTVASDSSSFLKIHSEPYRSSELARAATVKGQVVFLLDGGISTTKVEVLPYILSVVQSLRFTRLEVETAIYAEGLDNETSIILRCFPQSSLIFHR